MFCLALRKNIDVLSSVKKEKRNKEQLRRLVELSHSVIRALRLHGRNRIGIIIVRGSLPESTMESLCAGGWRAA